MLKPVIHLKNIDTLNNTYDIKKSKSAQYIAQKMHNKFFKKCILKRLKSVYRITQKTHNKMVKKCTKYIEKNIKICYSRKEMNLMKLTKKGYMPRLIDNAIEENLEVFGAISI